MIVLAVAVAFSATTLSAQGKGRGARMRGLRPQARTEQVPRRNALEQQFRERTEQVVRKRLNLNDKQVSQLRAVNADIGSKRDALVQQERGVRADLRDEMAKGSGADQSRVAQLMAQAHDLQAQRFSLQQDEQKQLSGFMSPVQVAQYVGLQAQIRQRIREMQRGQGGGQPNPDPNQ
jgi:hypothetical protein